MSVCCPSGGLGPAPLSSTTPKGKVVTLSPKSETSTRAPLACYQVGPENPKRIICVFSDVYGIDSGTHKAYCDTLQERLGEFTAVWMPDLFRGSTLFVESFLDKYLSFDAQVLMNAPRFIWAVKTRVTASAIDQDIIEIIQPAMKDVGCEKIGCAGFCFGGTVVCRAMGVEGGEFAAGVGNHAAFKPDELMAGGTGSPEELFKLTGDKPVLFLNAIQDKDTFSTSKLIQEGAERRGISPSDMAIEFPDMNHGFVTRGDPADPVMRENQEKALDLAVKFFTDKLSV
eukprot:Nitzschia sp. Nitz4//scaffold82_size85912//57373//58227//NITZ4_005148-RA/size85912-processed-gene-0.122-mRNA-1//-1//CDS//3329558856//2620//frame0